MDSRAEPIAGTQHGTGTCPADRDAVKMLMHSQAREPASLPLGDPGDCPLSHSLTPGDSSASSVWGKSPLLGVDADRDWS